MKDSDRFKLYFGPCKTPRFKYGKKVWCEYRGWMKIVGLSDAKIPWPIGRLVTAPTGRDSLVIYGDPGGNLKKADILKKGRFRKIHGGAILSTCHRGPMMNMI